MVQMDTTISGRSYIDWQYGKGTIIAAPEAVDEIIDEFGWWVTLRDISKSFSDTDEYGEATDSYTDYSIMGMPQTLTTDDEAVKEGHFQAGDTLFYFKEIDYAKIKPRNKVKYRDKWFKITAVTEDTIGGELYRVTAKVEKC